MTDVKLIGKLQASCNEHVGNVGFIVVEMKKGNKKNVSSVQRNKHHSWNDWKW